MHFVELLMPTQHEKYILIRSQCKQKNISTEFGDYWHRSMSHEKDTYSWS